MMFRCSTSAIAVALIATGLMVSAVQAANDAKYPDWKGAWTRWFPREPYSNRMTALRPAVSLPMTRPSPGGEDRKLHFTPAKHG